MVCGLLYRLRRTWLYHVCVSVASRSFLVWCRLGFCRRPPHSVAVSATGGRKTGKMSNVGGQAETCGGQHGELDWPGSRATGRQGRKTASVLREMHRWAALQVAFKTKCFFCFVNSLPPISPKPPTSGDAACIKIPFGWHSYTLLVSRTRTNFGDRAFSAVGPRVWNYLRTDIQPFQTVDEDVFVWSVRLKRSVNLLNCDFYSLSNNLW